MSERPRILVVNDDGADAEGIIALAGALRACGTVTVVAPDGDRSGTSHAISTQHTVRALARPGRAVPTFACSGTPVDCVILGAHDLCGGRPDIVVSGINRGANLADDVNYSGTVAGAVEAVVIGIPAIAISLAASYPHYDRVHHWETAAAIACDLVVEMLREPLPSGTYWNVNVPNVAGSALRGIRYTRQGRKSYADRLARTDDGTGANYYWVWSNPRIGDGADTDIAAVAEGFASITPLRIDRTDERVLHARAQRSSAV